MVNYTQKIISAFMAVLFATVGLVALTPAAAEPAALSAEGLSVDILFEGVSKMGETLWLSDPTASAISLVVARNGAGDPAIDLVVFGPEFPLSETQGDQFGYANTGVLPTDWTATPGAGIDYESPDPAPLCAVTATCPDLEGTGHTFAFTMTPDPGITDFAPVSFQVFVSNRDGFGDQAGLMLGFDATAPTSSVTPAPVGYLGPSDLVGAELDSFAFQCTAADGVGSGVAFATLFVKFPGEADFDDMGVVACDATDKLVSALFTGDYAFYTIATDVAGNVEDDAGKEPTVVKVDLDAPEATLSFNTAQATPPVDNIIHFDVAAGDDHSGLVNLVFEISDDAGVIWTPEHTFTISGAPVGAFAASDFQYDLGRLPVYGDRFRIIATDDVGQVGTSNGIFFNDVTPPTVAADLPSGLNVKGLGTVTFTVTDDASGSGVGTLIEGDVTAPAGAVVTVVDDTFEVDLSSIDADGTYGVSVTGRDAVDNEDTLVWSITRDASINTPTITTGTDGLFSFNQAGAGVTKTIGGTLEAGWTLVSWGKSAGVAASGSTCDGADLGVGADFLPDDISAVWSLEVADLGRVGGFSCTYTLTVTAEDTFGNAASALLSIQNINVRTIDTMVTAADSFLQNGGTTTLTVTATDATDFSVQPNVRVNFMLGETLLAQRTTNAAGQASLTIGSTLPFTTTPDEYAITAVPVQQFINNVGFRNVVQGDVGDVDVTFTRLVAGTIVSDQDAYVLDDAAILSLPITWAHDGTTPATGLTTVGGVLFPKTVGHTLQSFVGMSADGIYAESVVPGTYEVSHTRDAAVSLDFQARGSSVGYQLDATDPASTFALQTPFQDITVDWVQAIATISFENLVVVDDTTPNFVNVRDRVQVNVAVTSGSAVEITNAGVTLFTLDGADVKYPHFCRDNDADCDLNPAVGTVGFLLEIDPDDEFEVFTGPNTYTVFAQVTSFSANGEPLTTVHTDAAERTLYADSDDLVFTSVAVVVDAVPNGFLVPGVDPALDRYWVTADSDETPDLTDVVTVDIMATWDHFGAANEVLGAIVCLEGLDGTVIMTGAVEDCVTTDASGAATFTLDPDALGGGLDYILNSFQFGLKSAPEIAPGGAPEIIVDRSDVGAIEVVWTKVDITIGIVVFDDTNGHEANGLLLGDDIIVSTDAKLRRAAEHIGFDDTIVGADFPTFELQLVDTVAAEGHTDNSGGFMWTKDTATELFKDDLPFNVARGCTDLNDCANTPDADEAGWHNFQATAINTPYNLGLGLEEDFDALWTAIALDTTTDRLTQEVGSAITYTTSAYYAHGFAADGSAIDLEDRVYPNQVAVEFATDVTGVITPNAPFVSTVNGKGAAQDQPGHAVRQAVCNTLEGGVCDVIIQGSNEVDLNNLVDPINIVVDAPELARLFLALEITPAFADGEATDADALIDRGGRLAMRGEQSTVAFTANVLGEGAALLVDAAFAGVSFSTTDTAEVRFLADRMLAATPEALGTQMPFTVAFDPEGLADPATIVKTTTVAFSGAVWEASVPESVVAELRDEVFVSVSAALQVTDNNADDMATTLGDLYADDNPLVVTAINIALADTSLDAVRVTDGTIWVDWNEAPDETVVDLNVIATWNHDDSVVTDAAFLNGAADDAGAIGGTTFDAGVYTIELAQPGASALVEYDLFAYEGTSLLDDEIATKGFVDGDGTDAATHGRLLTNDNVAETVVFTRVVFDFIDDGSYVRNVGDGAQLAFFAEYEHAGAPDVDFATIAFDVGGVEQVGVVDDEECDGGCDGTGTLFLFSPESQTVDSFAPTMQSGANGITRMVVSGTEPSILWTRLLTTFGTPTDGTDALTGTGTSVDPYQIQSGGTAHIPVNGLLEKAGASDVDIAATGFLGSVLGMHFDDEDDDGTITAAFTSGIAQTIAVDATAVQATHAGETIFENDGTQLIYIQFTA